MSSSNYTLLLILFTILFPPSTPQILAPNSVAIYRSTPSKITATPCTRSSQCSSSFPHSACRNRAFCQCSIGYIEEYDKCLPVIMDLESACEINAQCQRGLGPLSICSRETNLCQCVDTNGNNATVYGSQRCYYRKFLGSQCDLNEECRASMENVRCDVASRRCVCEPGFQCRDDNEPRPERLKSVAEIKKISCNELGDCYSMRDPTPQAYSGVESKANGHGWIGAMLLIILFLF